MDNEIMEKQQQIEELISEKKFGTARCMLETMNAPDIALLFGEIPREEFSQEYIMSFAVGGKN